ncbi:hypothetical protein HOLleu_02238 [Holothuria leucospilota]|uniref:Uncharacterized protein n=1 Tax=Holothuria leucospilota TaxID=206669 RepID=A0A9Q1CS37_HOLLE|nr:hypothetical protein HOLleu_02238 [Holothuria leucospilota]
MGRVSKVILDRINESLRATTKVNQLRNTTAVIDWFISLADQQSQTFMVFGITSISQKLLIAPLASTKSRLPISELDCNHARLSVLFSIDTPWTKQANVNSYFGQL